MAVFSASALGGAGLTFATGVLAARWLGPAGFGQLSLVRSVYTLLAIVAPLGLDVALLRHLGESAREGAGALARVRRLRVVAALVNLGVVAVGGPEHEAVLRTRAKPSHIHAGLLLLGLRPGSPVVYDERNNTWIPPHGPPVRAIAEWTDAAGASHRLPAEQLMCSIKDGTPMPPTSFIFAGSHVRPDDGAYLADFTGYVVSICNFEHTLLDVPRLVSSANETLEWQTDLVHGPAKGTAVTLILEPVDAPSTQPSEDPQIIELERRRQALLDEAHRIDQQIQNVRAAATAPVH